MVMLKVFDPTARRLELVIRDTWCVPWPPRGIDKLESQ